MKSITLATILTLAALAAAVPPFDPAGAKNVGNGQGGQFITGQCLSNADCGSGCCAKPTGICSGPGASTQNGKQGCGFGGGDASSSSSSDSSSSDSSPAPAAAPATASKGGPAFDPAGAKNVGNGKGQQFIGGQCLGTSDCASGCCAGPSGICSGVGAQKQAGKTGCGFPNASTDVPSTLQNPSTGSSQTNPKATTNSKGGPAFDPAGVKNVGNGKGQQFIGGQCLTESDCASGCCAGPSGICSGPGASTQNGKTGCGFPSTLSTSSPSSGSSSSSSGSSQALPPNIGGPPFDPAGVKNVGNGKGGQFITGQCLSAADCQSGCCAGPSGICSGPGASTQAGKTGCGFNANLRFLKRD